MTITVGYNFGLPLSHLLLARQLENTTTLRSKSVVNDTQMRQRRRVVDAAISVSIPVIGILLHLSQQVGETKGRAVARVALMAMRECRIVGFMCWRELDVRRRHIGIPGG